MKESCEEQPAIDFGYNPYGEFPHKHGLQKFDRAAAEEMAANYAGLLNRMVSWARGESAFYPIYIGHPDLPGYWTRMERAMSESDRARLP